MPKLPQRFLISLLWCLLCGASSSTVAGEYVFSRWLTEHGLPQNSVYSILQTRDGYLWLTTLDGLVRFDGLRFTVFDKSNTKGLITNRFIRLFEARDGSLWIVTEDDGLVVYKDGKFTSFTTNDGLPGKDVRVVRDDSEGNIWIFTTAGLARYKDGRFFSQTPYDTVPYNLSFRNWFGGPSFSDKSGLHVFRNGRYTTYTQADGLPSLNISSLYEDQQGALWGGTTDAGLFKLKEGRFSLFTTSQGLPANNVDLRAAYEDRQGNVWLSLQSGFGRLKDGRFTALGESNGLSSHHVINIYEDREGLIWLGTYSDGLYQIRKQSITTYSEKDNLSLNNIYTIQEDSDGSVWIGTWGGGLNKFRDGVLTRYSESDLLPTSVITCLYHDREGSLWVAHDERVSLLKGGKFSSFSGEGVLGKLIVQAILQDREGSFWFGGLAGLARLKDGIYTVYTTKDGLPDNNVTVLHEDHAGNLWVGTSGGLSRFSNGHSENYTDKNGLAGNHVRSLYEDRDSTLWIGTYDSGLSRFKNGKFTNYTTKDGLFNNGAFEILEDDRGYLWMSCNRGIYRVARKDLNEFAEGRIKYVASDSYGKEDGLINLECNGGRQPAGYRTRDGKLWFATQGGAAVVDPGVVPYNAQAPPVVIEEVLVAGSPSNLNEKITVLPGQNSFEVHYTGLSFMKPEQVRFKYKLEGLEADWTDAGNRRAAYYSYVPPGEYTFKVIATNSDGVWNTIGASVPVVVLPPFWQTWWFRTLAMLFIAAAGFFVYAWRVRRLKRAHEVQQAFSRQLIESQENERKRIAAELHDSLGQSLVIIKNQALLGLNTPGDQKRALQQMTEISATASDAISEVKEIAYNLRPYQLDRLGLTRAIEGILNKMSASSQVRFVTEIDPIDGAFSNDTEINLYRIVQESVNNIIKHSEATEARLEIRRDRDQVLIMIRDNGKGFTIDGGESRPRGLGLMGISERAGMLGAKHEIRSVPGQGTTVTIKLEIKGAENGR